MKSDSVDLDLSYKRTETSGFQHPTSNVRNTFIKKCAFSALSCQTSIQLFLRSIKYSISQSNLNK